MILLSHFPNESFDFGDVLCKRVVDDFQIHMTVIMDDPIAQSVDVRPWDVGILFTKLIRQVFCVF